MPKSEWIGLIKGGTHREKIKGLFKEDQLAFLNIDLERDKMFDKITHGKSHKKNIKKIQDYIKKNFSQFLDELEKLQDMKLDALYVGWNFVSHNVKSLTRTLSSNELAIAAGYICDIVYAVVLSMELEYSYLSGGKFAYPEDTLNQLSDALGNMNKRFDTDLYKQIGAVFISILKKYPKN